MQAELMHDMIREWPRYVKVPLPVAKVNMQPFYLDDREVEFASG